MQPTTAAASALRSREDLFGTSAGAPGDSIMYPTNEAAAPRLMDSVTGRARPSLEQQLMRTRGYLGYVRLAQARALSAMSATSQGGSSLSEGLRQMMDMNHDGSVSGTEFVNLETVLVGVEK
jgi:hypothetical protein